MVEKYIKHLLRSNDKVAVPGLGTFVAKRERASFTSDTKSMLPPRRDVHFEEFSGFYNDDLLKETIAQNEGIGADEAYKRVAAFADDSKSQVDVFDRCNLKGLGVLKKTPNGDIILEQEDNMFLLGEGFGLPSVDIVPVKHVARDENTGKSGGDKGKDGSNTTGSTNRYMVFVIVIPAIIILSFLAYVFFDEGARQKLYALFQEEGTELVEDKQEQEPETQNTQDSTANNATDGTSDMATTDSNSESSDATNSNTDDGQNNGGTTDNDTADNTDDSSAQSTDDNDTGIDNSSTTEDNTDNSTTDTDTGKTEEKPKTDNTVKPSTPKKTSFVASRTGRYYLIVASLSTKESAMRGAKKFEKQGYSPKVFEDKGKFRISVADAGTQESIRVKRNQLVGAFPNIWAVKY